MHYCCLAAWAAERGLKLFQVTPKFHFWIHIAYLARYQNPRLSWCYADEDLVGLTIEVAQSCSTRTISLMVLVKWLILAFDIDDQE